MTITDQFEGDEVVDGKTLDAKLNPKQFPNGCTAQEFVHVINTHKKLYPQIKTTVQDASTLNSINISIVFEGKLQDERAYRIEFNANPDIKNYTIVTTKGAYVEFVPSGEESVVCLYVNNAEYDYRAKDARSQRVRKYAASARKAIEAHVEEHAKDLFEFAAQTPVYTQEQDLDDLLDD